MPRGRGVATMLEWLGCRVGEHRAANMREEETGMQYLEFITTLNPVVLAILLIVLACGAYDYWAQSR